MPAKSKGPARALFYCSLLRIMSIRIAIPLVVAVTGHWDLVPEEKAFRDTAGNTIRRLDSRR